MKVTRKLRSASALITSLIALSSLIGCRGPSEPVSPPMTEQTVAQEIKKIQDDPKSPPEAKARQIAKIKSAFEDSKRQNNSK